MDEQEFSIVFRAPNYEHREKTVAWYWTSIVIALVLLSVAVWEQNYFFALFLVIAEVLILVWADRPPEEFPCTLDTRGLRIGNAFYPWRDIESFSIHDNESLLIHFLLRFKNKFKPQMRILVPHAHAKEVERAFLLAVPETDDAPSLIDILGDFLGF